LRFGITTLVKEKDEHLAESSNNDALKNANIMLTLLNMTGSMKRQKEESERMYTIIHTIM
jgi:hypothetical protein